MKLRFMRAPLPRSGLLLSMLALIAQLALGGFVPRSADLFSIDISPICHAPDPGHTPKPAPQHDGHLLCPLCTALFSGVVATLPSGAAVPMPLAVLHQRAGLPPPATAPPAAFALAARPRGPPSAFLV